MAYAKTITEIASPAFAGVNFLAMTFLEVALTKSVDILACSDKKWNNKI